LTPSTQASEPAVLTSEFLLLRVAKKVSHWQEGEKKKKKKKEGGGKFFRLASNVFPKVCRNIQTCVNGVVHAVYNRLSFTYNLFLVGRLEVNNRNLAKLV
jgi:hypothetical protein